MSPHEPVCTPYSSFLAILLVARFQLPDAMIIRFSLTSGSTTAHHCH